MQSCDEESDRRQQGGATPMRWEETGEPAAATTVAAPFDEPFVELTLRDIIPCNLRSGAKFLRSTARLRVRRERLVSFLRCYGYLMYDRAEKTRVFTENCTDPAVREVAAMLIDLRDIESLRVALTQYFAGLRELLDDEELASLDCIDGDAPTPDGRSLNGRQLLALARSSLEHVLSFLRDDDHLRRAINVNQYCRHMLELDSSRANQHVNEAWYNARTCDLNGCLSVLVRDLIISTGEETHNTLLLLVRGALLFTLLVTQFYGRDGGGDAEVSIYHHGDNEEPLVASVTRDYFERHEVITGERLIATIFVAVTRSAFVNYLEWPCRLLENARATIDLDGLRVALIQRLRRDSGCGTGVSSSTLRWLHTFVRRQEPRLYVNNEALLGMLEQMSQRIDAKEIASLGASDLRGGGGDLTVRFAGCDRGDLRAQYTEYTRLADLCARCIADFVRDYCQGLGPRDYATASPTYVRSSSDDAAETVVTAAAAASNGRPSESEAERFAREVGASLMFSVLALVRHDVAPLSSRLISVNYPGDTRCDPHYRTLEYDALADSFTALLMHSYERMYRAKISVSQIQNFLQHMVTLWNEQVGIVGMEQLGSLLLILYRMFPSFNGTPNDTRVNESAHPQ